MQSLPLRLADRWLAPAPAPEDRPQWLASAEFAHRGVHDSAVPENSLASFSAAVRRGFGIECDIQKSTDGKAVVFHDFELDRMTCERGPVAGRPAAELAKIALGNSAETIPTLRDMLELVAGRVPLLIEIKTRDDSPIAAICLAVRNELERYRGPHAIISFDPWVCRWFAQNSPDTPRGLSFREEARQGIRAIVRRHQDLWNAQPQFLTYDVRDLPSTFASSQRARGFPLVAWTIKDASTRERAWKEADGLISEGEGLSKAAPLP